MRCHQRLLNITVTRIPREADMSQTTIAGHQGTHHSIAESLWSWRAEAPWILAGIILMLALGDVLVLLALVFAIVTLTAAWWTAWSTYRTVEHRVERDDAELAPVAHLRPASTSRRNLKMTSVHAPWRGPSAA
jgi:hypothetical protein